MCPGPQGHAHTRRRAPCAPPLGGAASGGASDAVRAQWYVSAHARRMRRAYAHARCACVCARGVPAHKHSARTHLTLDLAVSAAPATSRQTALAAMLLEKRADSAVRTPPPRWQLDVCAAKVQRVCEARAGCCHHAKILQRVDRHKVCLSSVNLELYDIRALNAQRDVSKSLTTPVCVKCATSPAITHSARWQKWQKWATRPPQAR